MELRRLLMFRDLLWVAIVAALAIGWFRDRQRLERENLNLEGNYRAARTLNEQFRFMPQRRATQRNRPETEGSEQSPEHSSERRSTQETPAQESTPSGASP